MKFIEASLTLPLTIMIICGLIVMTMNFFCNLYANAEDIHSEVVDMYSVSMEETIRLWDEVDEIFEE